ncbi:MAG: phosphatase PAP2-related protein [Candidatus Gracilibacteria bacterium]|nr:phosphatase PAP2-related protein [Candidatus Gracilibacteria bacterium]
MESMRPFHLRLMRRLKEKFEKSHRPHVTSRHYWGSVFFGLILLSVTLVLNFYAGEYASNSASNSVTDIVLSNTRPHEVEWIFIHGTLIFVGYIALLCFWYPGKTPFILKSIALFVLVRSISISLTHIGPFPTQVVVSSPDFLKNFIFTGDLFFSGHTGLPFLIALIFWKNRLVRTLCITTSIAFGTVVLLGHIHYSIDVFSAFFITYSVYRMSEVFFHKDHLVARESL